MSRGLCCVEETLGQNVLNAGRTPTIRFQTATDRSKSAIPFSLEVEVVEFAKEERPFESKDSEHFVHGILATIPLDGAENR